ncbi:T9SS type A sorting domain-containing protein [Pontibacter actiniarum]|uniref:T9SS C-terminal target domain-containing protein n=1 Tax=Pontibacter actiniarum TaxID=323450 RepID=A0A1X9YNV5_9BACT|nr:T9SS type A sorting domain-containing protein [Pontibacter actiniarum]ARS34511.1 T9SS C-terminal target domain-containing protein [Pontibacter actiniarum]
MFVKQLLNAFLTAAALATPAATFAQAVPPAATETVKVEVPEALRQEPFDVDRFATIPKNFKLELYARVSGARFMAVAPNGDLFVSMPWDGVVRIVRERENDVPQQINYASGLERPHDIVFHKIGDQQYVYIAEKNKIIRYKYSNGDEQGQNKEVLIDNLPDESLPELKGNYGHVLKNIALDSNHNLYVSIASTCNACVEDTQSNPKRGAIYIYNADGTNGRLFAEGLRNAEGLDFVPGTNDLWVTVNNRDQIAYPFNDGSGNYGKVVQSYVDNNPPEEFTLVHDGGNYGWPFCNPDQREGMENMPFINDVQLNPNGSVDCSGMDRISRGIQAHTAPLGLLFTQGTPMPEPYRNGALVALHGSWNRSKATGYKIIYFPWQNGKPGDYIDLVGGFLNSDSTQSYARPVDIAIGQEGSLYISDDAKGAIYRLTYTGPLASAEQEQLQRAVQVYPVPARGNLKLRINGLKNPEVRFILTNAQSANVLDVTHRVQGTQKDTELETEGLAAGVYFLSIVSGDTRVVRRVVLQ